MSRGEETVSCMRVGGWMHLCSINARRREYVSAYIHKVYAIDSTSSTVIAVTDIGSIDSLVFSLSKHYQLYPAHPALPASSSPKTPLRCWL